MRTTMSFPRSFLLGFFLGMLMVVGAAIAAPPQGFTERDAQVNGVRIHYSGADGQVIPALVEFID
jgi:hypothetical protein